MYKFFVIKALALACVYYMDLGVFTFQKTSYDIIVLNNKLCIL